MKCFMFALVTLVINMPWALADDQDNEPAGRDSRSAHASPDVNSRSDDQNALAGAYRGKPDQPSVKEPDEPACPRKPAPQRVPVVGQRGEKGDIGQSGARGARGPRGPRGRLAGPERDPVYRRHEKLHREPAMHVNWVVHTKTYAKALEADQHANEAKVTAAEAQRQLRDHIATSSPAVSGGPSVALRQPVVTLTDEPNWVPIVMLVIAFAFGGIIIAAIASVNQPATP